MGLISRNVVLISDAGASDRKHWGGEIETGSGFARSRMQGVQLEKFGKAKRGSYAESISIWMATLTLSVPTRSLWTPTASTTATTSA